MNFHTLQFLQNAQNDIKTFLLLHLYTRNFHILTLTTLQILQQLSSQLLIIHKTSQSQNTSKPNDLSIPRHHLYRCIHLLFFFPQAYNIPTTSRTNWFPSACAIFIQHFNMILHLSSD